MDYFPWPPTKKKKTLFEKNIFSFFQVPANVILWDPMAQSVTPTLDNVFVNRVSVVSDVTDVNLATGDFVLSIKATLAVYVSRHFVFTYVSLSLSSCFAAGIFDKNNQTCTKEGIHFWHFIFKSQNDTNRCIKIWWGNKIFDNCQLI